MTGAASTTQQVLGNFGRLWGRGHETLQRKILRVTGPGATQYLQNLVTCDLTQPPVPPRPEPLDDVSNNKSENSNQKEPPPPMIEFTDRLRSSCFLDPKGRVITDALMWKIAPSSSSSSSSTASDSETYYIETPDTTGDTLLEHLQQYKLRRSKVTIDDCTTTAQSAVIFGTLATTGTPPPGYVMALDPRHPSLGLRLLKLPPDDDDDDAEANNNSSTTSTSPTTRVVPSLAEMLQNTFPESPGNYEAVRRLAGVAEGSEIAGRVALETNQEHLNAVSFHKGCYLGQELTARVHHTGVLRKRIMPILFLEPYTQVPQPWVVASQLQEGRQRHQFTREQLALLPSRLPRLSVAVAGTIVTACTASMTPTGPAVDEAARLEYEMAQTRAASWLEELQNPEHCAAGAKILDAKTGDTIGQIVSPPLPGTNVALALMRLESVGLLKGGTWSRISKVHLATTDPETGESRKSKKFRYLPYLPLWWPELDRETGKAFPEGTTPDYGDEARPDSDEEVKMRGTNDIPDGMTPIEIEELPLYGEKEASPDSSKRFE